jgi:hypothetical protein
MKYIVCVVFFFFGFIACYGQVKDTLTVTQLISNPDSFNNKIVVVTGYVVFEMEGTAIYSSYDDCKERLTNKAIWLSFSKNYAVETPFGTTTSKKLKKDLANKKDTITTKFCSLHYAVVEGVFLKGKQGHLGMFSGSISNVKKISYYKK